MYYETRYQVHLLFLIFVSLFQVRKLNFQLDILLLSTYLGNKFCQIEVRAVAVFKGPK